MLRTAAKWRVNELVNDILELYTREGLTTGEIADRVGCAESLVVKVLRKHHYIND